MGKINKVLQLHGLSCTACETRIENKLDDTAGVLKAEVSYQTSTLSITYEDTIVRLEEIIKAIESLDYRVTSENAELQDRKRNSNSLLLVSGIMLFGIYLIVKNTIGFSLVPEITSNKGYGILFAVGFMSSFHCVAMCGGINLSLCVSYKFDKGDDSNLSKFVPSLLYNGGRIVSYTVLGGIVGGLGSVFQISNSGSAFVSLLTGAFMVIMGLNMLNIFLWLRRLNPHMPKLFAKSIHNYRKNGPFLVGLLNGFMPCGPLQAMQLYALGTGSFITGALSMFMFSLGTIPLLFAFGALGSMLSAKSTKNMVKASAVLVVVLGLVMITRGFAFTGITINSPLDIAKVGRNNESNIAIVNGDIQEITTTLQSGSYTPITVKAGIPVKWTVKAEDESINGCNNEIIIPNYNISQKLSPGENIINFTPTESGTFGYSCWMGMIRSSITVSDGY